MKKALSFILLVIVLFTSCSVKEETYILEDYSIIEKLNGYRENIKGEDIFIFDIKDNLVYIAIKDGNKANLEKPFTYEELILLDLKSGKIESLYKFTPSKVINCSRFLGEDIILSLASDKGNNKSLYEIKILKEGKLDNLYNFVGPTDLYPRFRRTDKGVVLSKIEIINEEKINTLELIDFKGNIKEKPLLEGREYITTVLFTNGKETAYVTEDVNSGEYFINIFDGEGDIIRQKALDLEEVSSLVPIGTDILKLYSTGVLKMDRENETIEKEFGKNLYSIGSRGDEKAIAIDEKYNPYIIDVDSEDIYIRDIEMPESIIGENTVINRERSFIFNVPSGKLYEIDLD